MLIQRIVQPSPLSNFRPFHHSQKKHCILMVTRGWKRRELGVTAVSHLLSASTDLPVLHISYEWSHAPCDLLCLVSLTQPVFKVYLCYKM
jgi:hypothetical protein